jgi:hypothetical protein
MNSQELYSGTRYAVIKHGYVHEDGETDPNTFQVAFPSVAECEAWLDKMVKKAARSDYFIRQEQFDRLYGWVSAEGTEILID